MKGDTGSLDSGSYGLGVSGSGFRVQGLGFRVGMLGSYSGNIVIMKNKL